MSYIRSVDASLYYEEYGAGEVLVLIPGLFGTIETDWRRFIPEFARHFHTIAVDLRGHGKTDNPSGSPWPDRLLADLLTLFDTLDIGEAFVCSHGPMALLPLEFAVHNPDRLLGLILHSPEVRAPDQHARSGLEGTGPPPVLAGKPFQQVPATPDERAKSDPRWVESIRFFQSIQHPDNITLQGIRVPLLVTVGEDDVVGDPDGVSRIIPGSVTRVLPRSGRAITTVQKREFIDAAIAFSRDLPGH